EPRSEGSLRLRRAASQRASSRAAHLLKLPTDAPRKSIERLRRGLACLLVASLGAAAFEGGGVHPNQWAWSALAISLAAGIALFRPSGTRAPKSKWLSGAL